MKALFRLFTLTHTSAVGSQLRHWRRQHGNTTIRALCGSHGNHMRRCYHGASSGDSGKDASVVDLRSDFLTKPSEGMMEAMSKNATWGDDVLREDTTVNELQRQMADMFQMEAALYLPSGTMGNLISLMSHCNIRGQEVLLGDKSHPVIWEQGGISHIGGIHPRTMPNLPDGTFSLDLLDGFIRPKDDPHQPRTGLIAVENTHNYCGGRALPLEFLKRLREQALGYGIPVHMDGARVMNASVAQDIELSQITQYVDSICVCFSKGIGAPVGSIIGGTNEFIERAVRLRKVLGGGWRQPGPLAAACIHALQDVRQRMKLDHQHAKMLGQAVFDYGGDVFSTDIDALHTNLVYVDMLKPGLTAADFCARLQQITDAEYSSIGERILVKGLAFSKVQARLCIYTGVTLGDVEKVIAKIKYVGEEMAAQN